MSLTKIQVNRRIRKIWRRASHEERLKFLNLFSYGSAWRIISYMNLSQEIKDKLYQQWEADIRGKEENG